MPIRPMGPWIDGWVPDSSRYVPGRGVVQVSDVVPVGPVVATSVPNDCTRFPCGGGFHVPAAFATGQVTDCEGCSGLATYCAPVPNPPPSWPTIMIEVGMWFVAPLVVNERLFVRLICRVDPVGTVITTGV